MEQKPLASDEILAALELLHRLSDTHPDTGVRRSAKSTAIQLSRTAAQLPKITY